ncbi:GTPase [Pseudoxanthomonas sp. GM95]|uniref:GTPase n=1 Tax=Pseudoxanthomonas sp. GM95 TaxID=1881043 RepID=UPI0020C938E9|nr:GTPase [Pseudoxanthomonas sp. GM95]
MFLDRTDAETAILSLLPGRSDDLARLKILARVDGTPIVTVIGKYNHGKSSLLNVLCGASAFDVADKRQTIALSEHLAAGVRWLDAPGLDADVASGDDREALTAAWQRSDIRLLVHAAKEGELDNSERQLLGQLDADDQRTRRQTLFILSQVDQLEDETHLAHVTDALATQAPHVPVHLTSSVRYSRGMEGGKALLVARSGIPALKEALQAACALVPEARKYEVALRHADVREEVGTLQHARNQALATLLETQVTQAAAFSTGLSEVLDKARDEIQELLDHPGPDDALRPDTHEERFQVTAGKLERARQQLALTKVNRRISSYLVGHGVEELPPSPGCVASSLNTVMVAVLGISVKYLEDMRRIYCAEPGRAHLQARFTHYYEISKDRLALAELITAAVDARDKAACAAAALQWLEAQA